jgi:CubicO group peptidase (beta-lactamase class C family)
MGMVFERATGRTVTQWLDQTLWAPLGAQNAGSFSIDSVAGGFEKMESGLNGTPTDIIRLGVLYLMVVPSLDIVVARFGRQYALGAPPRQLRRRCRGPSDLAPGAGARRDNRRCERCTERLILTVALMRAVQTCASRPPSSVA